jgi:hypothetical protein
MSKINVIAIDKEGNQFPKEIDRKEIEKWRQIAEAQGYNFRIEEPLTEDERIAAYPPPSSGQSFKGGLLQGLTASLPGIAQDLILGKETKEDKTRLEAGKPIEYGVGQVVGGLGAGIAAGGAGAALGGLGGAALGGKIGAIGGPAGAAAGALLGGALGGAAESYFSQPEEERSVIGDFVTPAAVGLIPGGLLLGKGRRLVKAVKEALQVPGIKKSSEKIVQNLRVIEKQLNDLYVEGDKLLKKFGVNDYDKLAPDDIQSLSDAENALLKQIKNKEDELSALHSKVMASGSIPGGMAAGGTAGAYGGLSQIRSPEELASLNRQAAERAYEEAVRKKTEKMLSEADVAAAEQQVRKTVEEQTAARLKKLKK